MNPIPNSTNTSINTNNSSSHGERSNDKPVAKNSKLGDMNFVGVISNNQNTDNKESEIGSMISNKSSSNKFKLTEKLKNHHPQSEKIESNNNSNDREDGLQLKIHEDNLKTKDKKNMLLGLSKISKNPGTEQEINKIKKDIEEKRERSSTLNSVGQNFVFIKGKKTNQEKAIKALESYNKYFALESQPKEHKFKDLSEYCDNKNMATVNELGLSFSRGTENIGKGAIPIFNDKLDAIKFRLNEIIKFDVKTQENNNNEIKENSKVSSLPWFARNAVESFQSDYKLICQLIKENPNDEALIDLKNQYIETVSKWKNQIEKEQDSKNNIEVKQAKDKILYIDKNAEIRSRNAQKLETFSKNGEIKFNELEEVIPLFKFNFNGCGDTFVHDCLSLNIKIAVKAGSYSAFLRDNTDTKILINQYISNISDGCGYSEKLTELAKNTMVKNLGKNSEGKTALQFFQELTKLEVPELLCVEIAKIYQYTYDQLTNLGVNETDANLLAFRAVNALFLLGSVSPKLTDAFFDRGYRKGVSSYVQPLQKITAGIEINFGKIEDEAQLLVYEWLQNIIKRGNEVIQKNNNN